MKLITLLHLYQPFNQKEDIIKKVAHESYLPLTSGLLDLPHAQCVFNISGSLLTLLERNGLMSVIDNIGVLMERGQLELTSSAMYHALLPLTPESEIRRQIDQHNETCTKFFGDLYNPTGFFPPEMAVSSELLAHISSYGYSWIPVPDLASPVVTKYDDIYIHDKTGIHLLFRNKRVSSLILSSVVKGSQDLLFETQDIHNDAFWFVIVDAETFGHHRIGHERSLFDILRSEQIETLTVANYLKTLPENFVKVPVRSCTWTNSEQDFFLEAEGRANSFTLWQDPENPIHAAQWELTNLAIKVVNDYSEKESPEWKEARGILDYAIASDQYWWASAKPWWSLEMIELGAFTLKDVILNLNLSPDVKEQADRLYRLILDRAFEWHRTGYVQKVHMSYAAYHEKKPFKDQTHLEWYNQVVLEFEDEMNKAASKMNFELAIKWRDAVIKLKQGNDIFDVLHVIDELWSARTIPSVKPFFDHTYEEFSTFAKEYFLGFKTKEEFEEWKADKIKRYTQQS